MVYRANRLYIPDLHHQAGRYDEIYSVFGSIADYTEQHPEIKTLIFLGDNFNKTPSQEEINVFMNMLSRLRCDLDVIIAIGNHEPNSPGKDCYSNFQHFHHFTYKINIVRNYSLIEYDNGTKELVLSYRHNRPKEHFTPERLKGFEVVSGHFSIDRFYGSDPGNLPIDGTEGPIFLAGHVHTICSQNNLHHVGSAIANAFDEGQMEQRYMLHYENPDKKTWIPLRNFKSVIMKVKDPQDLENQIEAASSVDSWDSFRTNIKLVITGPIKGSVIQHIKKKYQLRILSIEYAYTIHDKLVKSQIENAEELDTETLIDKHFNLKQIVDIDKEDFLSIVMSLLDKEEQC